MNTSILSKDHINQAVKLLKQGEVVAIPTETVYGLAADADQPKAIQKIFELKQRPHTNPLIVHIADIDQLKHIAQDIPEYAHKLMQKHWPGPLTLVLKKQSHIHSSITADQDTVAIRMPNHPVALQVIKEFKTGLVAPSANTYMHISPTQATHVLKSLGASACFVLDGGACTIGIESTIVDCTGLTPQILREGMITKKDIDLTAQGEQKSQSTVKVPGQHKKHYAPNTPMIQVTSQDLDTVIKKLQNNNISFSGFGCSSQPHVQNWINMPTTAHDYAQKLYTIMHNLEDLKTNVIISEKPPQEPSWDAIHERLSKACSTDIDLNSLLKNI